MGKEEGVRQPCQIIQACKRRQCVWNSIKTWPELHHSAKVLNSCVNIAGVVQNTTWDTVFMGYVVTFSSSHLLQSLDNPIWKNAFKKDKPSFLIVDLRSLTEKPRQQTRPKMNRSTIRFYWGTFFLVPNLHVFFNNYVSLLRLWKNKYIWS